jgi:hypothetical protein
VDVIRYAGRTRSCACLADDVRKIAAFLLHAADETGRMARKREQDEDLELLSRATRESDAG